MPSENKSFKSSLPAISIIIGSITAIYGAIVIIAWQNDISFLKTFGLGAVPVKANAGACFLLAGIALVLLQLSHHLTRTISRLLSLIVITIGFLSFVEIVFSVNLGIDEILFRKFFLTGTVAGPTRMALNATICLVLLGILLLFLSLKNIRFTYFLEFCLVLAISISIIGLLGFTFGLQHFAETTGYSNMAVFAALIFLLMCSGVLFTFYSQIPLKIEIGQRLFAGLIFTSTLLLFIAFLSGSGYVSIRLTSERADHSQRIKNYLNLLLSDVQDVETGVLGYSINYDEDYIKSMSKAREDLSVSMRELTKLLQGDKKQQLRLDTLNQLVFVRIGQAELLKSVIHAEGKNAGLDLYLTKKGKILTDRIRMLILKMKDDENQLLKLSNEKEVDNSSKAQSIIYLNLIIELILLVLIFIVIRNYINQRNKAIIGVRRLNEELETKVNERTLNLAQSEEKYRYMFANNPQPMWIYDLETLSFLEVNNAAIHQYGYSREEFLSMTIKDIRHEVDIEALLKEIEKTRKSYNTAREWRHLKKNGEFINVETISHTIIFNNLKARHVMITDITERKRAEEEIRNTKEALESLNERLNDIREDERASISREIHDQLGQSLTALKINADWLRHKISSDPEKEEKVHEMISIIKDMIIDVQRISSELRPAILDDIGLVPAMEWYIHDFEKRSGINCILNLAEVQFTDQKKNLVIYRILQEALTNVTRHSFAKDAYINLYRTANSISMEIIDNGIGLEKEKITSYKSLGFIGIRERLKPHNGTIDIQSILQKETRLTIIIPFT